MTDRTALLHAFIDSTDWAGCARETLAGDASNRRYDRLSDAAGRQAVLMDAPPEKGEDVRPFLSIARHLTDLGLSAPKILAEDRTDGFLILEDLGDDLFARVIPRRPELELTLYQAATDVLSDLHRTAPPAELAPYDADVMTDMAALAWDWYAMGATGVDPAAKSDFCAQFHPILTRHAAPQGVLIQRDYHAENLLWLPDRQGSARVGLLDFQDAMIGHRAYDLVSLLQDARRDVPPQIEAAMIARYASANGQDPEDFSTAYAVLGAQRNLRILGVFARLCMRDGKAHYVDLIPRVWDLLMRDLDHPALTPVARMIHQTLPAPTLEILEKLKAKCATIPKL